MVKDKGMLQDCTLCGTEFNLNELKYGYCKTCKDFVDLLEESALEEEHEQSRQTIKNESEI